MLVGSCSPSNLCYLNSFLKYLFWYFLRDLNFSSAKSLQEATDPSCWVGEHSRAGEAYLNMYENKDMVRSIQTQAHHGPPEIIYLEFVIESN